MFASLEKKVAMVTGSSAGIGRAIAVEFAKAGATVLVHHRQTEHSAKITHDAILNLGGTAHILQADIGNAAERERLVEQAWSQFGSVDLWVNNAGVDLLTGPPASLEYLEKLAKLLEVDVSGTVHLSRLVGTRMSEQTSGVLLNIGWDQADRGMEGDSGELFSVAKNAIMGFTRSLAVSMAPNVRVNCIAPGWIQTAWGENASEYWQNRVKAETPLDRWGRPEDIANMARFLCSDEANYITGQVININGGAVR